MTSDAMPEGEMESGGGPQSFWAELGLPEPEFLDESLAPAVNEAVLRSLVRQELPERGARAVYRLIYAFRSWHEAHAKILLEELSKTRPNEVQ